MPSASLFIITAAPYATSVPLYLKTWPKWLGVLSLALASTMLTLFYLEPLRKKQLQTPKSTKPPRPCRYLISSILQSTYSPPAAPLAPDKTPYRLQNSKHHFPYSLLFPTGLLTFTLHVCHSIHSRRLSNTNLLSARFAHTSFGTRSFTVAGPKSGTLSLYLSVCVPVLIPTVVTSRPTTASKPSNPLNPSPLAPQIRLC